MNLQTDFLHGAEPLVTGLFALPVVLHPNIEDAGIEADPPRLDLKYHCTRYYHMKGLDSSFLWTDGIEHVCRRGTCSQILDVIEAAQPELNAACTLDDTAFQVWIAEPEGDGVKLTCIVEEVGHVRPKEKTFCWKAECRGLPKSVKMYVERCMFSMTTVMLPSER